MTAPAVRERPRRVTAGHLRQLQRCERELWLSVHLPSARAEPGDFERTLRQAGIDHERAMRALFPGLVGPIHRYERPYEESAAETLRYLRESRAPLHQPVFLSADGTLAGVPDFLYWDDEKLVLCEVRLRTRIGRGADVALQMAHFRALAETACGVPVARCEVLNGEGECLPIEPCAPDVYRRALQRALDLFESTAEPALLKAHSTCQTCGYYGHCWTRAIAEGRLEVLPAVRSEMVPRLQAAGFHTIHDVARLEPLAVPGVRTPVLERIRLESRAWVDGRALWMAAPALPAGRPVVWLDLEGDPGNDAEVPVYLWGAALDGEDGIAYQPIIAEPGADGDLEAWQRFLAQAGMWLERHPDAVWVHWSEYERMWLLRYAARHGDAGGVAARVGAALIDLHEVLRRCAVLPLRSYSIKEVAPWLGFRWSHPDMSSQWSTVQYRLARATGDDAERQRLFDVIAAYNRDDLLAMKAVWTWMLAEGPAAAAGDTRPVRF
jgi:predicted RecB family nuclease